MQYVKQDLLDEINEFIDNNEIDNCGITVNDFSYIMDSYPIIYRWLDGFDLEQIETKQEVGERFVDFIQYISGINESLMVVKDKYAVVVYDEDYILTEINPVPVFSIFMEDKEPYLFDDEDEAKKYLVPGAEIIQKL